MADGKVVNSNNTELKSLTFTSVLCWDHNAHFVKKICTDKYITVFGDYYNNTNANAD